MLLLFLKSFLKSFLGLASLALRSAHPQALFHFTFLAETRDLHLTFVEQFQENWLIQIVRHHIDQLCGQISYWRRQLLIRVSSDDQLEHGRAGFSKHV
jgi:hypothetical protein